MITELTGSDLGVYRTENYLIRQWAEKGKVVFSLSRQGKAMRCHLAANRKALRYLKSAINEFVCWVFNQYKWCKMVIATVVIQYLGLCKILKKCSFKFVCDTPEGYIYTRIR